MHPVLRNARRRVIGATLPAALLIVAGAGSAAAAVNEPPVAPVAITSLPGMDGAEIDGYGVGTELLVETVRDGVRIAETTGVVGTDGVMFVNNNHDGQSCWKGITPDLRAGDRLRVTPTAGGDTQVSLVANVTINPQAQQNGDVVVTGTALGGDDAVLPAANLSVRLVAPASAGNFQVTGTRRIEAPGQGTIVYDPPLSTTWVARFQGLSNADEALALAPTTVAGLSAEGRAATELTAVEVGNIGGPQAADDGISSCGGAYALNGPATPDLAAASDTGVSSIDDLTSDTTPTFVGVTRGAVSGRAVKLFIDKVVVAQGVTTAGGAYSLTPGAPISEGVHEVDVSEQPVGGGFEGANEFPLEITVDTTPPAMPSIDTEPAALSTDDSPAFTFISPDPETTTSCSLVLSGGTHAFAPCTSPTSFTGLTDGVREFAVRATDTAGNHSAAATSTFEIDTQATLPVITQGPSGPTASADPSFVFTSNAAETVECSLEAAGDPDAFAACTSPFEATGLADGDYVFKVRSTDGLANQATATRSFSVDTVAPDAPALTSVTPLSPSSSNAPRILGSAEGGATVRLYGNSSCGGPVLGLGSAAALPAPGIATSVPSDAVTTFFGTATDAAGNVSPCSAGPVYTEDSTAPAAPVIQLGPSATTAASTASFVMAASEPGARVECSLSAGAPAFLPCSNVATYTGLLPAAYTFIVRATDAAGNASTSVYGFTVVQIVAPTAAGTPAPVASTTRRLQGSVRMLTRGTLLRRNGTARVRIACRGPRGRVCFGRLQLRIGRSVVARKSYAVRAGRRTSTTLRLTRKGQRLFTSKRKRINARVQIVTRIGNTSRTRTQGRLTLVKR